MMNGHSGKSSRVFRKTLSLLVSVMLVIGLSPSLSFASSGADVSANTTPQATPTPTTAVSADTSGNVSPTPEATQSDTKSAGSKAKEPTAETSEKGTPPVLRTEAAADVDLTLTTDRTAYADGEYASFNVKYTLDYGKVQKGDTITIILPDVLKNASIAYSTLHFSACNDLGNGTYQLVFNDSAPTGLTGYFSVNAFTTNVTTTNKTGTVTVGDKTATITVSPSGGGTAGTETRAIEKWGYDGTGYTQDTAQSGVYSEGAVVRFAIEADPRHTAMKNVIVTDALPDELEFVDGSIEIEKETPDPSGGGATSTPLSSEEAAKFIKSTGQDLEFDFGDLDGSYFYRVYYKAKVVSGTNVKFANTARVNYDNGDIETSDFTLKPSNGAGAAVGYKKVDKTVITDDPSDQTVTYTITFDNDNAFAAGDINLADALDSNVGYVTAYGSQYFTVTWDATAHAVKITNDKEIPASAIQTVTIVTDFSKVSTGTTVTNTVGGNTVKTKKTPAGKLSLVATKTVDGKTPASSEVFSFLLKDSTGATLQTKQNTGGDVTFDSIYYGKEDVGKTFTYTVSEADPAIGYSKDASIYRVTVTPTLTSDETITATPTITEDDQAVGSISFDNKVDTVSKSVTKTWSDDDNQDGMRPTSIQVQLYAAGKASGDPVTLDADNGWKYEWTGLAAKAGGKVIDYTVSEVDVPDGYNATVTDDGEGSAFGITDAHTPATTEAVAKKVWDDQSDRYGFRPSSVAFQLQESIGGATATDVEGRTAVLDADNAQDADTWTTTFSNLPKYSNGKEVVYSVRETSSDENYAAAASGLTVTNALLPSVTPKGGVSVSKSSDKQDVKPDDAITYTFTASNDGTTSSGGVWIKDFVPQYTTYVSCDSAGKYGVGADGREYVWWYVDDMAAGSTQTFTMTVRVDGCLPDNAYIENVAMYESPTPPPTNPDNNPSTSTNKVQTSTGAGTTVQGTSSLLPKTGDDAAGTTLFLGLSIVAMGWICIAMESRRRKAKH